MHELWIANYKLWIANCKLWIVNTWHNLIVTVTTMSVMRVNGKYHITVSEYNSVYRGRMIEDRR
jgi:hypothetical protein